MPRSRRKDALTIAPAGESACVVRLGDDIAPTTHRRVLALLRALDAAPPPGLLDLTPTYATILIQFDPLRTSAEAVAAHVRVALAVAVRRAGGRGRLVRIPVHYGGADGPDLEPLARELGLAPADVVRLHAGAEYRVYFLGFIAGFPYLGGLPPALAAPRLPTPRTRVPAGSVGIAGQQTGLYPVASPGGWRLIGRTPATLFDPAADPPTLLRPGDRVRFVPADPVPAASAAATTVPARPEGALPWLRILRPGPLTTVQDLGRTGYARYGVATSGAADGDALRLGNALLGNPPGAPALEVTLGGLTAEALDASVIALTGAECGARVNGRPLPPGTAWALATGDRLELGPATRGVRAYLAVAGGVAVTLALGSAATEVRTGLGGYGGRALAVGDALAHGAAACGPDTLAGRRLPDDLERRCPTPPQPWRIRVTPGPHATRAGDMLSRLVAGDYTVDARSDRLGVRLAATPGDGPAVATSGGLLSEGVPRGAVQVPPSGDPVILLADNQTTGGYLVPAVVIAADIWKVAQLRPGDAARLELVTVADALAALRARAAWLAALAVGAVAPERLMRGFSEWSEEANDDG
ncbi:MAG TPA: 5-oxoprolinase subunit PxpB [Ktedonobacterales bacterium]|nr:5-oxoprolinase subunit PxpB [Ktedonobacterales bacterium]